MKEMTFKNIFFRLYDRKISDGTITFSQLGISKMDFTRLCMEENFVLDKETIIRISDTMNLTEEEKDELLEAAERS